MATPVAKHPNPVKRARQLALVAVLLILTSLIASSIYNLRTSALNLQAHDHWHLYNSVTEHKGQLISRLYQHLGYVGMIHHFKNAILRREPDYLESAGQHIELALAALADYRKLSSADITETAALQSLENTIQAYSAKISQIRRLIDEGATAQDIDSQVKMDDLPASAALATLRAHWQESYEATESAIERMFHNFLALSRVGAYGLPAYLLLSLIIIFIFLRLIISLQRTHQYQRESEQRSTAIVNNSAEAIITINSQGKVEIFNPAAAKLFGYTAFEVIGNNVSMLMPEKWRNKHDDHIHTMATRKDKVTHTVREIQGQHKDGRQFPLEISIAHLPDQKGDHYLGICRDITQRKSLEYEQDKARRLADQARREAEAANRAKSQFLSKMSHELRTPLNAILGFSQVLRLDPTSLLSEIQQQRVAEIEQAGAHLLRLVDEILDLAKIEAGRLQLEMSVFPLDPLLKECQNLVTPMLAPKGLGLELETGGCTGLQLESDFTRLKQVLLNLLSNACKYNREDGMVTLRCRVIDERLLRISVSDTGAGLTADQQARLFTAFDRLGAEQTKAEGTGIGLMISKQLIEQMGGTIGVESEPGQGSTFWIELPRANDSPKSTITAPQTTTDEPDKGDTPEYKLLYIEDNPANLRLVSQMLEIRPGYRLLSATEPLAGLELAQGEHPDLILLDINLPGMNGYQLLDRLRQQPGTRAIPVIAISANAMPADIERARQVGFADYLTKPLEIEHFFRVLSKQLPYQ